MRLYRYADESFDGPWNARTVVNERLAFIIPTPGSDPGLRGLPVWEWLDSRQVRHAFTSDQVSMILCRYGNHVPIAAVLKDLWVGEVADEDIYAEGRWQVIFKVRAGAWRRYGGLR